MSSSENFLDSVNKMFDQSAALLNLSNGLAEKIKVAIQLILYDLASAYEINLKPSLVSDPFIQNIGNRSKVVFVTLHLHHKWKLKHLQH